MVRIRRSLTAFFMVGKIGVKRISSGEYNLKNI